jgi:threonine dehydrogenase-like Zn-dependent dehydrogenase
MKAARFHAHHDVRVEDVSPPELKDNEILVAIEFVQEEMLPYAALIEPLCVSWHAASQLGTDTFDNLIGP